MSINLKQLEINVNLYCLRPDFLNYELHYIIASNENEFRFAEWDELPAENEKKFYAFLLEKELFIPAGNITLKESYELTETPMYPVLKDHTDFIPVIEYLGSSGLAKCIKQFHDKDIDVIKNNLENTVGPIEKHLVTSNEAQHLLLVLNNAEISVSATMIYFRPKAPFSESHYNDAAKE
jgi:hypothetical protein